MRGGRGGGLMLSIVSAATRITGLAGLLWPRLAKCNDGPHVMRRKLPLANGRGRTPGDR